MAEVAVPEQLSPALAAGGRVRRSITWVRQYPVIPMVVMLIVLIFPAIFAGQLAPHNPLKPVPGGIAMRLQPPVWIGEKLLTDPDGNLITRADGKPMLESDGGAWSYPLGTDKLGRDMLSRIIYGARVSLTVALVSIIAGGIVGTTLGLVAGYFGGWWDNVIMRLVDIKLSLPSILLALVLVAALGPSFATVIVVIALVLWTRYARLVRGEVLSLKHQDFVARAQVAGCSTARILFRHLFPNVEVNTIMPTPAWGVGHAWWVSFFPGPWRSWGIGQVILLESTLSFLGAGIPLPTPAWGLMVADGRVLIIDAWWVSFFPGLAIALTVLSMNLMGDWLRDRLDPKQRNV